MSSEKELDKINVPKGKNEVLSYILDSRHITRVRFNAYDFKIVRCGDYIQFYYYADRKVKDNIKNLDTEDLKKDNSIIEDFVYDIEQEENQEENSIPGIEPNKISDRSIIRTKLNCQRLAKSNASEWKSFITLTYSENMQDIKKAKKDLEYFIKNIKKIKSDFKYIAIPEFQKRGAIHFHLLSNLDLQDNNIIIKQKSNKKYYDVKYWNKGFTSFELLKGDIKKIIGYISKYMTKECDNRLFSIRRFTSSQNLVKPQEEYINVLNQTELDYFKNLLESKECIYENNYKDYFDNEVTFMEFKNE